MRFVLMVILIYVYVYIYARISKLTFIMISREATVGGKFEVRKLRAVNSGRIPIVHGHECTITSMESIVFPQVCAGSGVGCTRSVNNAALDSRTQFSRAADVPRAKCEETRTRARKISIISRCDYI